MSRVVWLYMPVILLISSIGRNQANPPVEPSSTEEKPKVMRRSPATSLSVKATAQRATTRVRIEWIGQEADLILLVSFDELDPEPDELALFSGCYVHPPLLLKKIPSSGSAAIVLDNAELPVSRTVVIEARVVASVEINVLAGDPRVKGALRTKRVHSITADNAPREFRCPTLAENTKWHGRAFPNCQPLVIKGDPDSRALRAVVMNREVRAFIRASFRIPGD